MEWNPDKQKLMQGLWPIAALFSFHVLLGSVIAVLGSAAMVVAACTGKERADQALAG
jgi:hypothetical protein